MICHIGCMDKLWELQEHKFGWKRTPYVKEFTCLAEARKALISYQINTDFKDINFRLRLVKSSQTEEKR